jgi:peptide/nickel transport system permease protein
MTRFIATRLAIMPLLLWGVVTVAFLLSHAVARNPLASIVGERNLNNPAIVEAATQRWGLDQSLGTQYLIYLNNLVLHADLGTSIRTKSPVATDLADRLPATLELALLALVFATVIGVLLGVVAAQLRGASSTECSEWWHCSGRLSRSSGSA